MPPMPSWGRARRVVIAAVSAALLLPASAAQARVFEYLGSFGTNGASDGQFLDPTGVAIGPDGTIYVSDAARNRITRFGYTGQLLGGFGFPGSGNGQLSGPGGIATTANELLVADTGNNRIQRFSLAGDYLAQWGGPGPGNGQFNAPAAVAWDGFWVYVSDSGNVRIQKFSATGSYVRQWALSGTPAALTSDGAYVHPVVFSWLEPSNVFGEAPVGLSALPRLFSGETSGSGGVARDGRSRALWWLTEPLPGGRWILRRLWNDGAIVEEVPLGGPAAIASGQGGAVATDCRGTLVLADRGGDRIERWGDPAAPPPPCGTPAAGLGATSLSFGTQPAGTVGPPSAATLVATGNGIDVSRVEVTGADADAFLVSRDGCTGRTSWPGAPCSVSLRFAPTRTGDATATLRLTDATTGTTQVVALAGSGAAAPTTGPGPTGATGPAGKAGAAGGATASCSLKRAKTARASRVTCTARPASARVTISVARGGRVFASGSGRGTVRLKVKRALTKGRYAVSVSTTVRRTGSALVVR